MRHSINLPGLAARVVSIAVAAATLVASPMPAPATAGAPHVDPGALPRGEDPGVVHMVRDVIRDGDLRVPATTRGEHDALWVVEGGYVVRDFNVGSRGLTRVVFIDQHGDRRVVARSTGLIDVEVSVTGRRLAVQRSSSRTGLRSEVTVYHPRSGRLLARREFRLATLVAVTAHRVLLGRRAHWRDPATAWWNYETDRVRRIYHQAAQSADVRHDRIVFGGSGEREFCNRVAVLSHPARTLWRSCRLSPHQWSPDGTRAIATNAYFDAAGTDRWVLVGGRTGVRQARITGRFDWDAVWEDNRHFLTLAQSDAGEAAIIRCDLGGGCERASRIWDVPVPPDPSVYYDSPPVVLANR
jgi:hypothetical protein